MTDKLNPKDFADDCGKLPIVFEIQGDGCIDVWNEGYANRETLCGPGVVAWEGVANGLTYVVPDPGDGFEFAAMVGAPLGNRKITKSICKFFYEGREWKEGSKVEVLVITVKFRPPIKVTAPPAGNIFGK
jgi:hypothetical protein